MNKSTKLVPLQEMMADRQESVDPSAYPTETFDLFSIPAYDSRRPDTLQGNKIGSAKKAVQPNDVLLSRIVPHIRRSWVVPKAKGNRQIASGEWIVFRSQLFWPSYLRHLLMSDVFHSQFMNTVAGVGGSLLRARPEYVGQIEVPLPPLPDQKRIADILDKADAIRRKRREASAEVATLRRSRFEELFGATARNEKSWNHVRFADVLSGGMRNGISPSRIGKHRGKVLMLSAVTGGRFKVEEAKTGTFDEPFDKSQFVNDQDFLICRGNGNIGLVGTGRFPTASMSDTVFPDTIIAARIDSDHVVPEYLEELWGTTYVRQQLEAGARTTNGTYKVNQEILSEITIPVPPLRDQRRFSQFVLVLSQLQARLQLPFVDDFFNSLVQRAFRGAL